MPRRRIQDRLSGQRGLAEWVIFRQLLARRLLHGPLLAQFVAPVAVPARRTGRTRPPFLRPQMFADAGPGRPEIVPWIDAAGRDPDDIGLRAVASQRIDNDPESIDDAQGTAEYPVARDDGNQPATPARPEMAPPRPAPSVTTAVPPERVPPERALPPLRERLGRRVEERVQAVQPSEAAIAPLPVAPVPAGAPSSPVAPPSVNAPDIALSEMRNVSDDAGVALLPETPSVLDAGEMTPSPVFVALPSHAETSEPEVHPTQAPGAAPPHPIASDLPKDQPIPQSATIAPDAVDRPDRAIVPRDAAMQPPEAHSSAATPDRPGQPASPESEMPRPERPVNEERPFTPARESPRAAPLNAEPDVVAERPQLHASPDVPVTTPPISSPVTPGETPVADLFASRGTDRSPAAWLARLTGTAAPQAEQTVAPAPTTPPVSAFPTPFSTPTPRFVAPKQVGAPAVEPVGSEEMRAESAGPVEERAATNDLDPLAFNGSEQKIEPIEPPEPPPVLDDAQPLPEPGRRVIEQGAEFVIVAVSEDDGEIARARPIPDAAPAAPPGGVRAAELFASPGADRSPAAWVERLRRAENAPVKREPAPPITPGQSASAALPRRTGANLPTIIPPVARGEERAPTPLPETSRRFLQPLVGIDPGDVPVLEGARADTVTAAYGADALTDGNVVLLGAGNDADTPETLGLIAHELTHVARRRDPRFIPPIARADKRADRSDLPASAEPETGDTIFLADEEALARRVESRVADAVRATDATSSPRPRARLTREDRPPRADTQVAPLTTETPQSERVDDPWGGLPAPWEPLPGWLSSPAPAAPLPANVTPLPVAAPALAAVAPVPQLAEEGRASDGERAAPEPAAVSSHDAHTPAPAEPDLDALARQVYVLLKRRLALERRSFG